MLLVSEDHTLVDVLLRSQLLGIFYGRLVS